MLLPKVFLWY